MNTRVVLTGLVVLGLIMMESPVILWANKVNPMVLGMPFLLFWVLLWWAFCTVVLLIAFKLNWGKK